MLKKVICAFMAAVICNFSAGLALAEGAPEKKITIAGHSLSSSMNPAFEAAYPDVFVDYLFEQTLSRDELIADLVSGRAAADIYVLSLSTDIFDSMRQKGYCADLSGSSVLQRFSEKVYPNIRKSLMWQDRLIAIPYDLDPSLQFGFNDRLAGQLGLQRPETFEELVELFASWPGISAQFADEYKLSTDPVAAIKTKLLAKYVDLYILSQPEDKPLDFDTADFAAILRLIDSKSKELSELSGDKDKEVENLTMLYSSWDMPIKQAAAISLMSFDYPILASADNGREVREAFSPLILKASKDTAPLIPANMHVMVVNAASPNKEMAFRYLECLAEHYSPRASILFLDAPMVPAEDPQYCENMAYYASLEDLMRTHYEGAAAEDQEGYLDQLALIKECVDEINQSRWAISSEDIEAYQAIAPYIQFMHGAGFNGYSALPNLQKAIHDYVNGTIPASAFIRRFNEVQHKINAESGN